VRSGLGLGLVWCLVDLDLDLHSKDLDLDSDLNFEDLNLDLDLDSEDLDLAFENLYSPEINW